MDTASDLPVLSSAETRVLGCLIEKKETTPDIYPLTVNALVQAANQKTSREPVMSLEQADIHRALKQLEGKGLVRQQFASRVERYEHLAGQKFALTQAQLAILGLLMLRGPQTAYELLSRAERMARIGSIEELKSNLDLLIGRRPPLVVELGRAPGQREERFGHLLAGEPPAAPAAAPRMDRPTSGSGDLEARIEALEAEMADLRQKLRGLLE